ncbi:11511_t:CDS:1, partial [Funneliformis geosporum]
FMGTIGYSINFKVLALYSDMIGAYQQPLNSNHIPNKEIFDNTLLQAILWLSIHNSYLNSYTTILHQKLAKT